MRPARRYRRRARDLQWLDRHPLPVHARRSAAELDTAIDEARGLGLIYLDTCLVITRGTSRAMGSADNRRHRRGAGRTLRRIAPGQVRVSGGTDQARRPRIARAYDEVFSLFAAFAMPEAVYLQAAELRARFGVKTPDALHLACAQYHRCEALWTNDDRLAQASFGLARTCWDRPTAYPNVSLNNANNSRQCRSAAGSL